MKTRLRNHRPPRAFSLIELLVVIAIIGIIGAFAVPAAGELLKGSSMTQAANLLTDQTAAARQQAITRNRTIEVRFYRFWDPENPGENPASPVTNAPFRALQFFEIADGVPNPTGRFVRLPNSIVLSPEAALSSVLNNPQHPSRKPDTTYDTDLPRGILRTQYEYVPLRFQPDGSTDLSLTTGPVKGSAGPLWFITGHLLNDTGRAKNGIGPGANQVHNFFTWMIDPVSGTTKMLRPGVK